LWLREDIGAHCHLAHLLSLRHSHGISICPRQTPLRSLRAPSSDVTDIAEALLVKDKSQVEYYENITKNMVGRVLTTNRGLTEKNKNEYHLIGSEELSSEEIGELKDLCLLKIDEYIGKRGDKIWSHRKKSSGYISGTIRYEVLKWAKFSWILEGY
jgi:ATP adenylyltransferase